MKLTKVLLVAGGLVAGAVAGNAFTTLAQPAPSAGSGSQSTFVEMTPCRLVDTRAKSVDNTAAVQDEGALGKETKRTYTAAGKCGIPSNATSLSVNLAAITPTLDTFMTLWDTGSDRPNSSAVNPEAALSVTGNTTNVALSSSGKFDIYNNAGQVDYVIDVLGYYVEGFGSSARSDLTDTGDGFSLIFEYDVQGVRSDCRPPNGCYDYEERNFWGAVVNLENEVRWVQVVSTSRCPAYSLVDMDVGVIANFPAVEPGTIISDPLRVEPKSTTAIQFTGPCGGHEDSDVVGGGSMQSAIEAQTFATKEFIPD